MVPEFSCTPSLRMTAGIVTTCGSNVTSMTPGISDAARPARTSTRADDTPSLRHTAVHGE